MRDHLQGYEGDAARWDELVAASAASSAGEAAPVDAGPAEPEGVAPVSGIMPVVDITTLPFAVRLPAVAREQDLDGELPSSSSEQDDPTQLPEPISALRHFARPMLWQDSSAVPQHADPDSSTFDSLIAPAAAAAASDGEAEVGSVPAGTVAEPERRRLTWRPVRRKVQNQPDDSEEKAHLALVPEMLDAATDAVAEVEAEPEVDLGTPSAPVGEPLDGVPEDPAVEADARPAVVPETGIDLGSELLRASRPVLWFESPVETTADSESDPARASSLVRLPEALPEFEAQAHPGTQHVLPLEDRSNLDSGTVLEDQPDGFGDRAHLALVPETLEPEAPAPAVSEEVADLGLERASAPVEPLARSSVEPAVEVDPPPVLTSGTKVDLSAHSLTTSDTVLWFEPALDPAVDVAPEADREAPLAFVLESLPEFEVQALPEPQPASRHEDQADPDPVIVLEEQPEPGPAAESDAVRASEGEAESVPESGMRPAPPPPLPPGSEPGADAESEAGPELDPALRSEPEPDWVSEPEHEPKSVARLTALWSSRGTRRSSRSAAKPVRIPPPPDLVARIRAQQSDVG